MKPLHDTQWRHDKIQLGFPTFPPELLGKVGCRFERAAFDAEVGLEVYLMILDSPAYAARYAATRPFNLLATSGAARTSHGTVAYMVWTIAAESAAETVAEQFLNPHNIATIKMLSAVGQQSHVKVLVVNNSSGEVVDWFEVFNSFQIREFVETLLEITAREPEGNFSAAIDEVKEKFETADLLGKR